MKNLRTLALCVSLSLITLCGSAQNGDIPINEPDLNKPELFKTLPASIPVSKDQLVSLLDYQVGSPVSLNLSAASAFRFEGNVIASVSKYENSIQSVIVRSTNYPGARLTLSRITDDKGNITYTGRILSREHGDLYELKNTDNQFVLVKRKYNSLLNE
ncbi:MAG: hypothetical protein H7Y01_10690 [Ferruginibacter sp.]|nr:hypothetical protein [Chitinophagaceae bacterium]